MGEVTRLIESALTPGGDIGSLRAVIGPGAIGSTHAWSVWEKTAYAHSIPGWIAWHTAADVVVYLAYVTLLLRAVGAYDVARRVVLTLFAVEVAETVLLLIAATFLRNGTVPAAVRGIEAGAATAKWGTVAVLVITLVRTATIRQRALARLRLSANALKYQRLSAVPVVVLGALSTVPGPNLQDQLPDVERGWVGGPDGVRHGLLAFVASLAVAFLLFVLGRHRTRRAEESRGQGRPPTAESAHAVWLVGPAVVLTSAVLLRVRGPAGTVDWALVGLFCMVPLVVVVSSLVVRWLKKDSLWNERPTWWRVLVPEVRRAGDGLALAVLAIGGLGLVRAFTAPALVAGGIGRGWPTVLLLLGVALALATFPVGVKVVLPLAQKLVPSAAPAAWVRVLVWALAAAAGVALAMLMAAPAPASRFFGAVATMVIALGAWVVLVGFLVVYLQDRKTPEIFRLLHMRAAPVLTLFVLVPAVATLFPGQTGLHYVRTRDRATAAVHRLDLATTFTTWLSRSGACDQVVDGVTVRPLLVVAASGGGIRSAVWTLSVLDELARSGDCGRNVTLLSSGVSGGSLGLAVARQTDGTDDALARLAESDSLSVGLTGTLVGDLVAGMSGVRLPVSFGDRERPAAWTDRAGLMEQEWERAVPALADPWDAEVRGPGGALVLNSTATGLGCRVLVSQVTFKTTTGSNGANCRVRSGLPAASLDLFDTYGSCSPQLRWSTAAMLSSRFPTVTPAGRIPRPGKDCDETPDLQLIDGGYAEPSGVGTLADIAPELMALVRDHNASGTHFVVPLVAYFEDEVRSDVTIRPPRTTPEVLVPVVGKSASAAQGTQAAHLQRVARAFANPCPATAAAACTAVVAAIHAELPDGVALVAPSTRPSVIAPLGWTLSEDSRVQLANALADQRKPAACTTPEGRYAGLARLLSIVGTGPC
ncbi:MAG TPA: hypothetical protein VF519_12500 [Mycobacteriales bacterium]